MEIKIENAKAAFKTADESVKKVLLALLPELNEEVQTATKRPVIERVKTFEDALNELGEEHILVKEFRGMIEYAADEDSNFPLVDLEAYLKLRIICTALNEGWKPRFTEDEVRWHPLFYLWTDDELSERSDEWKEDNALISTKHYIGKWAGFAYARSVRAPSNASAYLGSRLCFKSEALATYCGKQFISLWADFSLIKKKTFYPPKITVK